MMYQLLTFLGGFVTISLITIDGLTFFSQHLCEIKYFSADCHKVSKSMPGYAIKKEQFLYVV